MKTSDAIEPEEDVEPEKELNYTAYMDLTAVSNSRGQSHKLEPVEVKDGKLTIGVQFGRGEGNTQFFFDYVRLYLAGAAEGFNYVAAAESIAQGVENVKANKVASYSIYDLNGRQIKKTQKGIVIVKKVMGDGTVKTQKVVK